MNDFIYLTRYVQLPTDKVAAILGWNVSDVKTPGEFDEIHLLDKDGIKHTVIEVNGEDRGIVISTAPGHCTSRGAKQIERLFGDSALSNHQRDRIERTLEELGLLTKRTVLVEVKKEEEDVWGWAVTTQTEIRIERADGKIVNTLDISDTRFIRGEIIALTAKTYNTISDAVWNDTNAYDDAFADIIQVMPGMLGYILQAKAVGNVPLWGVIDGPLATSQSVCFGDQPYHVAPEGFIGQFCVPGRAAVWNFIAAEKDGVVTVERHAL